MTEHASDLPDQTTVGPSLPDLDYVLDENPLHERTIHWYPGDPAYRRSGQDPPEIGDIARCGHVKKNPPKPRGTYDNVAANCPQCVRLRGLRG